MSCFVVLIRRRAAHIINSIYSYMESIRKKEGKRKHVRSKKGYEEMKVTSKKYLKQTEPAAKLYPYITLFFAPFVRKRFVKCSQLAYEASSLNYGSKSWLFFSHSRSEALDVCDYAHLPMNSYTYIFFPIIVDAHVCVFKCWNYDSSIRY